MMNRLPEKLTALRKHFGYSQGDIAEKLGIAVPEYMNWENGNSVCSILQLKKLAALYHVPLQDMADNARTVVLPRLDRQYDSVDIPFIGKEKKEEDVRQEPVEQPHSLEEQEPEEDMERTMEFHPQEEKTKEIEGTMEFEPTMANRIVDDTDSYEEDEEEDEEEERKPKVRKKNRKKSSGKNSKKQLYLLVGAAGVILGVIIYLVHSLFGGGSSTSVAMSDHNRLALGSTYSMYLRDNGSLDVMGNAAPSIDSADLVQVASGSSYAMGLKKDGTVVCEGSSSACPAKEWEDIVDIAAADDHTVGVKKDGTVVCNGSISACAVEDWKDISTVYAGNGFTIGRKKDGSVEAAGFDALKSVTSAADIAAGNGRVAVVTTDGKLTVYSLNGGSAKTYDWSSVKKAAVGEGFVAAISNGKLLVDDEDLQKDAESFSNLKYIAARGKTLIAVGKDNKVIGVGDNSSGVYNRTESDAEPTASASASASAEADKLSPVTNINFSANAASMLISWDQVPGASYYNVKVNTTPVTTVKAKTNGASVSADKLSDGTSYTVTVTAVGKDGKESEPSSVSWVFKAQKVQLSAPSVTVNISDDKKSVNVSWDAVANAGSYEVSSTNGDKWTVTDNSTIIDLTKYQSGTYTVSVVAKPGEGQNRFTDSSAGSAEFTYTVPAVPLGTTAISQTTVNGDGSWTISWNAVANAGSYNITIGSNAFSQSGITGTSVTVPAANLQSPSHYQIIVTAVPADAQKYTESTSTLSGDYSYTAPTPTPTPSQPSTPEQPADGGSEGNDAAPEGGEGNG